MDAGLQVGEDVRAEFQNLRMRRKHRNIIFFSTFLPLRSFFATFIVIFRSVRRVRAPRLPNRPTLFASVLVQIASKLIQRHSANDLIPIHIP